MNWVRPQVSWIPALLLTLVGPASSFADTPYFTRIETTVLPDGDVAQMRMLHGDGILFPDPIRAVVIDAGGRVIARSPRSPWLTLVCKARRECRAVDLATHTVFQLDPTTFRTDMVTTLEREALWKLEGGEASWGFRSRPASVADVVEANIAMAHRLRFSVFFHIGCGLAVFALAFLGRPTEDWVTNWIRRAAKLLGAAVIMMFSIFGMSFSAVSVELWLASLLAGALLMGISAWVWRRRRPAVQAA